MATADTRSTTPRRREMTLEGILVPRRWKASGEVTALALNTLDEREFVIDDPGSLAEGLLRHLRKRVRLTGVAIGNRLVDIATVSVLDALGTAADSSAAGEEK